MKRFLFSASAIRAPGIGLLRIWCGVIFIRYGASISHAEAMTDFAGTLQTAGFPLPTLSAWICKISEFSGGILLVAGCMTKISCAFLMIDMIVATFAFHHGSLLSNGLTTFLLLLCLLQVFLNGADPLSLDYYVWRKLERK